MNKNDILSAIADLWAPKIARSAGTPADLGAIQLNDLDLDSLDLIQLVVDLEDKLGIEVDADDLPKDISLAELVDLIAALEQERIERL